MQRGIRWIRLEVGQEPRLVRRILAAIEHLPEYDSLHGKHSDDEIAGTAIEQLSR